MTVRRSPDSGQNPAEDSLSFHQDDGKGGVEFKGGSLHDGFGGFDSQKSTLPSFCLSYKIQCQETTVTVLAVSAVVAVWS